MRRNILLNPGPATTSAGVKEAMVVPDICPREREFGDLVDGIRNDLVAMAHGGEDYVAILFGASGTGGVEAAITSAVPLGRKLLVVVNGAYGARMADIAKVFKIDLLTYRIGPDTCPDPAEIRELLLGNPDVSHMAIVHHETTSGLLNPVSELAELAHEFGVETIVDAMSSFPVIDPDIRALGADYLISSSNKCIQGMPGVVFVLVRKSSFAKLEPRRRSFYFDLVAQHEGFNQTHQMPFTPPVQVLYAFRRAIDEYFQESEPSRRQRYLANWEMLYSGMIGLGFKPYLPYFRESKILFSLFEPDAPGYSFDGMHDYLYRRGFTIYPGKVADTRTFRLAVIGDLHETDIRAFLTEMANYLRENGIELK